MATLREIHEDLRALESLLWEVGGDVTDEEADQAVKDWFDQIEGDLNTKLDGYATVMQEMKDRAQARTDEYRRLRDLAKIDENAVARLKGTLLWFMTTHNKQEIQAPLHRFRVTKNGGVLPVTVKPGVDPLHLKDSEFVQVRYEWDMGAIRQALENGRALDFATMEERGSHVRIK